ncbi:hypothetical protein ACI8AC_18690 [Geodermatophilus sp. SYSU D00758]
MQATMPQWTGIVHPRWCQSLLMTLGIVAVTLTLLGLAWLSAATLVVTLRGGRGPGDPPASHPRTDPAGFPVLPEPRSALTPRRRPAGGGAPRRRRTPARPLPTRGPVLR